MSVLYGEVIDAHSRAPRNFGPLAAPHASYEDVNPLCGDRIRIELRIERGRIAEARFDGEACRVAIAAASVLTGLLIGKDLASAAAFAPEALLFALRAPLRPSRVACATLPLSALRGAIAGVREGPP